MVSSLKGKIRGGRGRLKEGGRDNSVWWRMICGIRSGVGVGAENWFEDNVRRVVSEGSSTYFWLDNWVGGAPLRVQFPRLFDLIIDKEATVREMAERGWAIGGGAWVWRRRLLAWEEETVVDCVGLLADFVLQENTIDRWRWILDPINGYSVRGTYQYLTSPALPVERGLSDMVWLKHVPLKVSVLVWQLLQNKLPTKDNLVRRMVLQHADTACVGGCSCMESAVHLFLYCDIFGSLWHLIYQWVGISFIPPASVADHFHQFGQLAGLPRFAHSYFQLIWHTSAWVIWKERNNRIFQHKAQDLTQLLESVKVMSFLWLKAKMLTSALSYNDWWRRPFLCMGVRV